LRKEGPGLVCVVFIGLPNFLACWETKQLCPSREGTAALSSAAARIGSLALLDELLVLMIRFLDLSCEMRKPKDRWLNVEQQPQENIVNTCEGMWPPLSPIVLAGLPL